MSEQKAMEDVKRLMIEFVDMLHLPSHRDGCSSSNLVLSVEGSEYAYNSRLINTLLQALEANCSSLDAEVLRFYSKAQNIFLQRKIMVTHKPTSLLYRLESSGQGEELYTTVSSNGSCVGNSSDTPVKWPNLFIYVCFASAILQRQSPSLYVDAARDSSGEMMDIANGPNGADQPMDAIKAEFPATPSSPSCDATVHSAGSSHSTESTRLLEFASYVAAFGALEEDSGASVSSELLSPTQRVDAISEVVAEGAAAELTELALRPPPPSANATATATKPPPPPVTGLALRHLLSTSRRIKTSNAFEFTASREGLDDVEDRSGSCDGGSFGSTHLGFSSSTFPNTDSITSSSSGNSCSSSSDVVMEEKLRDLWSGINTDRNSFESKTSHGGSNHSCSGGSIPSVGTSVGSGESANTSHNSSVGGDGKPADGTQQSERPAGGGICRRRKRTSNNDKETARVCKGVYRLPKIWRVQVTGRDIYGRSWRFSKNVSDREYAIWLSEMCFLIFDRPTSLSSALKNGCYECLLLSGYVKDVEDYLRLIEHNYHLVEVIKDFNGNFYTVEDARHVLSVLKKNQA
jgi:hypothetical protein